MNITWRIDSGILALSLLAIAPGFSGDGAATAVFPKRALVETGIIATAAVLVSKSWWPIAAPAMYLTFDWLWKQNSAEAETTPEPAEDVIWQP